MADERSRDDYARLRDLGPLGGGGLGWITGAGAPVNGVTGTGVVSLGWVYTDTTTGYDWKMVQPGTTNNPQWAQVQYAEIGS